MNKFEKIKEVQQFIELNKGKTKKYYAENNGIITNKTFYEWCKKG